MVLENIRRNEPDAGRTIRKTLMTASLFSGFWDRWIAHGLPKEDVDEFRTGLTDLAQWHRLLEPQATWWEDKAREFAGKGMKQEAEQAYRLAGLYYNLIQWVYPQACAEKLRWFDACLEAVAKADELCADHIATTALQVGEKICVGRLRIPEEPRGCLVFINPYDSSKEELFTYEQDFARQGFVTFSFDGPGQGETYAMNRHQASRTAWRRYVTRLIDYAAEEHPRLPICLFGTSSGAAWALAVGSRHPKVDKIIAVSPACENGIRLPDYFLERLAFSLEPEEQHLLPGHSDSFDKPTWLFHGKQDVMVRDEDIAEIYHKLPRGSQLFEYEGEGHCCNYKLGEIRARAAVWFSEIQKESAL
jgi:pimeloyl-ACP methyl ester carboxylesterase